MKCVTVIAKDAVAAHAQIVLAQRRGADLIELRIDALTDTHNLEAIIIGSLLPVLATARGMDQKILIRAIDAGAKYIDMDHSEWNLEVAAYAKTRQEEISLVASYHDPKKTPPQDLLEDTVFALEELNPDIIKIVTYAQKIEDNEIVLGLLSTKMMISFCMGELGRVSRIICGACAPWTYFYLDEEAAPGQLPLRKEIYLLIGSPLSHSLSPIIQQAMLDLHGIDGIYLKVECTTVLLEHFFEGAKALGIKGINVTIPFKEAVIQFLDNLDPLAREMGAVNTILNEEGTLQGYNTDGIGVINSLKAITTIKGKKILLLGAGGGAKGAAHALTNENIDLFISNRTLEKAKQLAHACGAHVLPWEERNERAASFDIIINATSIGMGTNESPLDESAVGRDQTVLDLVYKPRTTKLLEQAAKRKARTLTGDSVLVHQAAVGFEIWTGKKADITLMRNLLRKYFGEKIERINLILIGFMGAGKTSVGKELAKILKKEFVDVDREIERVKGKNISRIFEEEGEPCFREVERRLIELLSCKENSIIAMGGGSVLLEENVSHMKESGKVILLEASEKTLLERLKGAKDRPLLNLETQDRKNTVRAFLNDRKERYKKAADVTVQTDGKSISQIVNEVIEAIR